MKIPTPASDDRVIVHKVTYFVSHPSYNGMIYKSQPKWVPTGVWWLSKDEEKDYWVMRIEMVNKECKYDIFHEDHITFLEELCVGTELTARERYNTYHEEPPF